MAVIDLAKTGKTAAFVRKALQQFSLPTDFSSAIASLASSIRDHKHFETILTSCDPEERSMLYEACRPHLKFTAKPLDAYIASAGRMAERLKLPTVDAEGKLHEFSPAHDLTSIEKKAEDAVAAELRRRTLTMVCAKCTRRELFFAIGKETPVDVVMKARKRGWIYDYRANPPQEVCPRCPSSLRPDVA